MQWNQQPDLVSEGLIGLGAASALVPARGGKRTSATTLWRWCAHGKGGVRLEHVRRPNGDYLTTAAAVGRFLARMAGQTVVTRQQVDAHEWAMARLRAEGVFDDDD